jgi:hypothetical protein
LRFRLTDKRREVIDQGNLWLGANDALGRLTVLEYKHGRNANDAVLRGQLTLVVNVYLNDFDLVSVLNGQLLEDWTNLAAWTTPLGPEIDQDWLAALQHVCAEASGGYLL